MCSLSSWSSLLILKVPLEVPEVPLSPELRLSRLSLLSRSGFFMDKLRTGGAPCGMSSLPGTREDTPLELGPEDEPLAADPVDSHSNESVPESPRLLEM